MESDRTQRTDIRPLKEIISDYTWFWFWRNNGWDLGYYAIGFAMFETMDEEGVDAVEYYGAPAIGIDIPDPPPPGDIFPCCGALKRMWHNSGCPENHDG